MFVVVKSTVTEVFVAPERRMRSVSVPLVSLTVTALVVRATVLPSLSVMFTTFVPSVMVASVGLLRMARKDSVFSCVALSVMSVVKVLFVSPAAKLRVALVAV